MDEKTYVIRIRDDLCEVSKEIYLAYYQEKRREKYLAEKDGAHGVIFTSLEGLEDMNLTYLSNVPAGIDDQLIWMELCSVLHESLNYLTRADRGLIQALFFENETEYSYSLRTGMSQSGISRKKMRILSKLRILMNSLGGYDDLLMK